ncbi:MAG: DNA-processing protein DprA [Brevinematia bacterium]
MEREEILFLNLKGFGFKKYSYIKDNFESLLKIPKDCTKEISKMIRVKEEAIKSITQENIEREVESIKKELKKHNINYITIEDEIYPERLKKIQDKPIVIYYKGDISLLNSDIICSIVGTRRNDEIGKKHTKEIVEMLVKNNVVIVSGLARGIDIIAHRQTLESGGYTIAVLAGGLNIVYPKEHEKDFIRISNKGCVISEFPPNTEYLKRNFFIRNRIISGLGDITIIIQAPEKSGALITGEYAIKQNKTLMVIPGNIENPLYRGSNMMIKKGAIPIIDYRDVLEELGYKIVENDSDNKPKQELSEEEKFVYSFITKEITIDELSEKTGITVNKIYPLLLSLEIKGMIIQNIGGTFSRIANKH